MVLADDAQRSLASATSAFYPLDERSDHVFGLKGVSHREALYETISRSTGTEKIELRGIPLDILQGNSTETNRSNPEISSIYPLEVTAGTQTVLTIAGQGFGAEQGDGYVAFPNADDGGQSFVSLQAGPHYLSWSDTQIEMYVPSATIYNCCGYGFNSGGYVYHMNEQLAQFVNGSSMVEDAFLKWACNTGVNFKLSNELVDLTDWAHDDINLIGLSVSSQLPSYLLGKTITSFSGCGTPSGLQWNLIEVDILLNSDINWWAGEGQPMSNKYDLETVIVHEMDHAHL
jgi:hypothetical protein